MKKIMMCLSFSILFTLPLAAILPPLYQNSKEIKSILSDPDFDKKLHSGEVLMSIQKNDQGYAITTNQHRLQIDVNYPKTGKIGPVEYTLTFHEPVSLPSH
jgi:hypothetical protein